MITESEAAGLQAKIAEAERRMRGREMAAKYKRKGGWRPTGELCTAFTQKGDGCKLWAYPDGLCSTHSLEREQAMKRRAGK